MENHLISLKTLKEEEFNKIDEILRRDKSVSSYVCFNYFALVTNGIFYKEKLIGLLNLNYFLNNSLSVSVALLEKYRGLGIMTVVYEKIIEIYGKEFLDVPMFIANVCPRNTNAIASFRRMSLIETHEFDDEMINEGAEFFSIFYKENPYRKLVKDDRK